VSADTGTGGPAHSDTGTGGPAHSDTGTGGPAHSDPSESVLDCSAVIADVWVFLDHECDPASRARLQQHLDDCGPCLTQFGIEEQVKSLLGRKCGGEQAPTGLRSRLSERIRATVCEQVDGAAPGEEIQVDGGRVQI
jgi:mycothiol system anti-sigma-R factor